MPLPHPSLHRSGHGGPRESAEGQEAGRQTRAAVIATAAVAALVTTVIAVTPGLFFAYRNPDLHVALLTGEALIASLCAYLVLGRLHRRRTLDDLVLCMAFTVLAASNLLFAAVPAIVGSDTSVFATWSALLGRVVGAALLAAAALVPPRRLRSGGRQVGAWAGVVAALLVIAVGVALFESRLPSGVEVIAAASSRPDLDGQPAVLAAQVVGFALLAVAAIGFTVRAERTGDALLHWLAIGAVLSAAARVNYFLYPSAFTEYVYTGDAFRMLFYVVVLKAALHEIRSYWSELADAAALGERQRIARDLHDGLAQELASVRRNLHWLDQDDPAVAHASSSADRAIDEARRAVAALADGPSGPLNVAFAAATQRIGEREGIRVVVSIDDELELPVQQRDTLVMIASEAITNAARHGHADQIRVEVIGGRRPRLRIEDFGRGFDPAAAQEPGHYGLRTMRERADAIGAVFRLDSRVGRGTRVEIVL